MKRPPPSTTLSAKLFPYPTLCRSRGHKYAPVLVSHGEVDQRREEHRDGQRDQQQPADVQDRSELDHAVARPPGRSTADGQASRAPRARSHGGVQPPLVSGTVGDRSEEPTSELQSLMRISYAVFCLKKKKRVKQSKHTSTTASRQPTTHCVHC